MKAVHLTSVHDAFDDRIFHKECNALVQAGYDVTIVAPHPQDEERDGIRIRAVPIPRSRRERMASTVAAVYRAALLANGEIYHLHDPELLLVGMMLKVRGKAVIYDAHESVPLQILSKQYIWGRIRPLVSTLADLMERGLASFCDAVITVVPAIAERFPGKASLVRNFPRADEIFPSHNSDPSTPYLVYVGGLSYQRGITHLVDAMSRVGGTHSARLKLAGNFASIAYEQEFRGSPGWVHTDYLGWQDRGQIRDVLAGARLGIATLLPTPNHLISYPIKLFEYMAAGVPVLVSDFPLWRAIVEGAACGLVVNPLSKDEIAEKITWLLDHPAEAKQMGENGRAAVLRQYNWEAESRTLIALYESLGLKSECLRPD